MPEFLNRLPDVINKVFEILDLLVVRVLLLVLLLVGADTLSRRHEKPTQSMSGSVAGRASSTLLPMASDLRAQLEVQFFKARDEYIAAIKAHSDALAAAMQTEATDVNAEYDRASRDLEQKRGAYRRATDDLRGLNSGKHE